ncbi:hypothetical protein GPA25_17400 [Aromatoleum diolicum]|uniref:Uncharacterized protein n=1 Tax=Aromatoleum diolicum TaxID=75796 RepID=A0ABX1QDT6_9RHOO|nr:hypothetical protein [Aromatoleum diolicum]
MGCCGVAHAGASLEVCFNYGCASAVPVILDDDRLATAGEVLHGASDAVTERTAIARAVGMLHRLAGEQTPIVADRAGNFLDNGVDGRMDCIDHSTNTTRFLELMAARGWLRFHRVLPPARRALLIFQHFSAAIEELDVPLAEAPVSPPVAIPDYVATMLALCDCSEVLAEIAPAEHAQTLLRQAEPGARFVVDSWFVDHGEPAVVLPLAEWLNGEGPNVQ